MVLCHVDADGLGVVLDGLPAQVAGVRAVALLVVVEESLEVVENDGAKLAAETL